MQGGEVDARAVPSGQVLRTTQVRRPGHLAGDLRRTGARRARAGTNVNDNLTLPGTGSQAATDLLEDKFPSQANGTNPVVLTAPKGEKITAVKYKSRSTTPVKPEGGPRRSQSATSPLQPRGRRSSRRTSGSATSRSTSSRARATHARRRERDHRAADPARDAGLEVGFGGYVGQKVSKPETHIGGRRPRAWRSSSCCSRSARSWRWGCRSSPRSSASSSACRSSR